MEGNSIFDEKLDITIARKVYNENCLTETHRRLSSEQLAKKKRYPNCFKKVAPCSCSWNGFFSFLVRLAPIVRWLPKYNVRKDLTADLTGGVTVGIMHIPQGNMKHFQLDINKE